MFTAALLAKGGGLIVTIFVARYLNANSLGVYAVVLSLTLLLELITPLGQQEVIVRSIARDRLLMITQWMNASIITVVTALGFSIILLAFVVFCRFNSEFSVALLVAAAGLPIAGLNLVAQAVLQGVERMEYQPFAAFIGRILGLLVVWLLLELGAGVWSAFVGRTVFQLTSFSILAVAILRHARQNNLAINWRPGISTSRKSLAISLPFALQRFLNEGLLRLHVIILPMLIAFEAVGQFNAANQITQTSSGIIYVLMLALLPVFSQSSKHKDLKMRPLSDQTLKFLLITIFPFAFIVTVAAQKLIMILYGAGYEVAVPVLQVIIWSQVFLAADSVMRQNMIASDNERAMVSRSAAGVVVNIICIVLLGKLYGLLGIAVAVVLSRAILLVLDAHFVTKHICRTNLMQAVAKPFVCAMLAGFVAFVLLDYNLLFIVGITICSYFILLILFKAVTTNELTTIRELLRRSMQHTY
jgi:O-antigen/teichoic acid export membrane protein